MARDNGEFPADENGSNFQRDQRELPPDRPLERWELSEYRSYWPALKRMANSYRFFDRLFRGIFRVAVITTAVFGVVWGARDVIGRIVKAVLAP